VENDLPLRTLTATRAADLLPILGIADAEVIGVESLELPATGSRLDTAL
jgi:hypothetical protein